MRIEFTRSGGFAGLSVRLALESAELPAGEREALEALIHQAGFFELPDRLLSPAADAFQYDLAIEREGLRHAVRLDERGAPEAVRPLLQRLTELARAGR